MRSILLLRKLTLETTFLLSCGPTLIWDDQKIVAFVVAFISHKLSKTTEKSFKRQRLITIRIWKRYLLQRTFMFSD